MAKTTRLCISENALVCLAGFFLLCPLLNLWHWKSGHSSVMLAVCAPVQFSNIFWYLLRASDCTWSCAPQHDLRECCPPCSWKSPGFQSQGFNLNTTSPVHLLYVPQQSVMFWASVFLFHIMGTLIPALWLLYGCLELMWDRNVHDNDIDTKSSSNRNTNSHGITKNRRKVKKNFFIKCDIEL